MPERSPQVPEPDAVAATVRDPGQLYQPLLDSCASHFGAPPPDRAEPRRLLHGRGHQYSGLEHVNVDWYPPVLLLSFYQAPAYLEWLTRELLSLDPSGQIESIVLQTRHRQGSHSEVLWGKDLPSCVVSESGLRYEVRPGRNRNAGLFLDMRPLRDWLQNNSRDRNVLNLFAYTCSLSVAALAGGARRVTSVDMNKPSIQWGVKNHRLNDQDLSRVKSLPHNLFTSWGKIKQLGRYDLIIIDPPTRQSGSFDVEKNYRTVIRRLPKLVQPGAEIIATVNSPFLDSDYLLSEVAQFAPQLQFIELLPPAPEFIEKFPERRLKIYRFRQP